MKLLLTYFIFGLFLTLSGQIQDIYTVHYTKYSFKGKIIKDTIMTVKVSPIIDLWTFAIGNDTIKPNSGSCFCKILIYEKKNLIMSLFDSLPNDLSTFEYTLYQYRQDGQLKSEMFKILNLPWMTTEYKYDEQARLKKKITVTARYGYYSEEYIYEHGQLIMKIITDNDDIDTLKIEMK